MNCCLWIILLLACRGNNGCHEHMHGGCGCMMNCHHEHEGCGCMHHMHMNDACGENCMESDDCGCGNEYMEREGCGCDDNRMSYETYGCQENGIPCPPPVPGNYMR